MGTNRQNMVIVHEDANSQWWSKDYSCTEAESIQLANALASENPTIRRIQIYDGTNARKGPIRFSRDLTSAAPEMWVDEQKELERKSRKYGI